MIGPATGTALAQAGHVARPVLTGGQALVIVALSAAILLVWVLLLVATKSRLVAWTQVRRFRAELRDLP